MALKKARTSIAAAIFVVVGPLLAWLAVVPPLIGFWIFAAGGLLAMIALVFGMIATVRNGLKEGGGNLIFGAVITVLFVANALPGRGLPRINDITTDTSNPPRFVAASQLEANAGRDLSYPGESFASQQTAGYPELAGLSLPQPPAEVFEKVQAIAGATAGWEVVGVDPQERRLEAVATSRLFRFQDDVVIEVRPAADGSGGTRVEMRSKSRVGRGDIGANAARIQTFFQKLKDGTA